MKRIDRTGEKIINNQGEKATIIRYGSNRDIDIQFEDGTILYNKKYDHFKNGSFKNPNHHKNIRLGETKDANNGQKMTIVNYNNSEDIDVEFEDGTIVQHKDYFSFQKGEIKNPNYYRDRIGETVVAKNGQKITIIEYRNAHDVDVQFEDGTIVKHRGYANFKNGSIQYPNEKRVGESYINEYGQTVTLIAYRNAKDIDVQFSDNTIVQHIYYNKFKSHKVKNPNFHTVIENNKRTKIGESITNNQGLMMTIIDYHSSNDICVKFEDGAIVEHKQYRDFCNGKIGYPDYYKVVRIGQETTAKNGQKMTIIDYRNARDIDVRFEDGSVVKHKSYKNFLSGGISKHYAACSYPECFLLFYLRKIGFDKYQQGYFKKYNKSFGRKEIDIFNPKLMIGIEYDGYFYHINHIDWDLEKNKLCKESGIKLIRIREKGLPKLNNDNENEIFRKDNLDDEELTGILKCVINIINEIADLTIELDVNIERDYQDIYSLYLEKNYLDINKHIGETNTANNGQIMEIIRYKSTREIDICFDDGTIVENIRYSDFKNGSVYNPNLLKNDRVGEKRIANNGQKMTLIQYRGVNDIDTQFEDGTVVKNKSFSSFKKGQIKNPNYSLPYKAKKRVGEKNKAINGQTMEIINYYGANNITIKFDDGTIVYNKTYGAFKKGEIKNPCFHHKNT